MKNYIFIVYNDNWDGEHNEMITTDFDKAFNFAYEHEYNILVWVDGDVEEIIDCYIDKSLDSALKIFKRDCTGLHLVLLDRVLPIIQEKKNEYDLEKEKLIEINAQRKIDKDLAQLAKLKEIYETNGNK